MPYEKPREYLNERSQKPLERWSHKKEEGKNASISIIDVVQDMHSLKAFLLRFSEIRIDCISLATDWECRKNCVRLLDDIIQEEMRWHLTDT